MADSTQVKAGADVPAAVCRYRIPEGVIDRAIGNELLVHRFDTDQVFVLNDDAKRVFEAVRDTGSDEAVHVRVGAEIFGDTLELDEQIDRALDEMRQHGLIEIVDSERVPTE